MFATRPSAGIGPGVSCPLDLEKGAVGARQELGRSERRGTLDPNQPWTDRIAVTRQYLDAVAITKSRFDSGPTDP